MIHNKPVIISDVIGENKRRGLMFRTMAKEILEKYDKEIQKLIHKTAQKGVESGFMVCKDEKGKIVRGNECIGDSCSVELGECYEKNTFGSFHTHPPEKFDDMVAQKSVLSYADVEMGGDRGERIMCVSGIGEQAGLNFFKISELKNYKAVVRCYDLYGTKKWREKQDTYDELTPSQTFADSIKKGEILMEEKYYEPVDYVKIPLPSREDITEEYREYIKKTKL